jgi:hypothetical protein
MAGRQKGETKMNETKKWYESKAVWGALIAVVASILSTNGVILPKDQTVEVIMQIVAAVGGVVALWGRIKADKRIK